VARPLAVSRVQAWCSEASCGTVWHVGASYGMAGHKTTLVIGTAASSTVRSGVGPVDVRLVGLRRDLFGMGMSRKPPSCWHGGRSTRPWWDSVLARWCPARYGKFGCVLETTPVQARFPIDAGGVGFHGKAG